MRTHGVNDSTSLLERIETLITSVYRTRAISPWDEGPMRAARFEQLFRESLSEWPLRNQTDLVYGGSTVLAFLLHPGHYIGIATRDGIETRISRLGGVCFQALLEISHLGPFARLRFTKETLDRENDAINYEENDFPFRAEDTDFHDSLLDILELEGIEIIPREILDIVVPDVELDVTERGSATIYHCLFDEE